jgi:hypothetical protein
VLSAHSQCSDLTGNSGKVAGFVICEGRYFLKNDHDPRPRSDTTKYDEFMAPRRGAQPSNALSPQDTLAPSGSTSPVFPGFPRSTSPSSGFTQFLTRPSKWFSRSVSASKIPSGTVEPPRPSVSSGRKHKISRPTDPRPILDGYAGGASR